MFSYILKTKCSFCGESFFKNKIPDHKDSCESHFNWFMIKKSSTNIVDVYFVKTTKKDLDLNDLDWVANNSFKKFNKQLGYELSHRKCHFRDTDKKLTIFLS